MKKRKGITLIEVVLVLALAGIVIVAATNMFIFSNKVHKVSAEEADIQATTRLIAEQINNIVRLATKTHTIPRSSFQYSEDGVRDPNTSYIGISKEGHVVIDEPGGEGQPRNIQYLAKKEEGIDFQIEFNKIDDKILEFIIIANRDGKVVNTVTSSVEVLNSLNIDHLGTPSDPAVALAYSMVDPGSQEWIQVSPDAYITLVLDISGSMAWDMNGIENSTNQKRIEILKEKSLKMIDRLSNMDFSINVALVPFSNNANNPGNFHDVSTPTGRSNIISEITALSASGSTNTGDGIRRAYHKLKVQADSLISNGKQYSDFTQHMMVLVDGATNVETRTITGREWFIVYYVTSEKSTDANGNTNNNIVVGNHREVSVSTNNNNYIEFLGNNLIKPYTYVFEGEQKQAINTFVIGFSNRAADHVSLGAIGNAINGKQFEYSGGIRRFILATDADELDFAFEQFESEVENNLWIITRPQLRP